MGRSCLFDQWQWIKDEFEEQNKRRLLEAHDGEKNKKTMRWSTVFGTQLREGGEEILEVKTC